MSLSHTGSTSAEGLLPDVQRVLTPGRVDFAWGHPADDLLPVADLRAAAAEALGQDGALVLAYGASQGPGRLLTPLAARLARIEGRAIAPDNLLVTGGVSQALDLLCTLHTRPGDVVLVESPCYHIAPRIFRDHGLDLWPAPADADGPRLDALLDALDRARRDRRRVRFLYTVPTFSNPTGRTAPPERRLALVEFAARHDLTIVEDDVYRELWYDAPPPPALRSYSVSGASTRVVRLGSFSKILAPGLRLGWMEADADLAPRAMDSGMLDSGGGVNHLTAHIVADYLRRGLLDAHVAGLRAAYRARRDRLMTALRRHLPSAYSFDAPGGGYFVWVRAPDGVDTTRLLTRAEAAGVSYVPGALFHGDGGDGVDRRHLRLSFSLLSPVEMDEGVRRLASVLSPE